MSSYAIDDGQRLILIDPTEPPDPIAALAAERDVSIVLTCPWHGRDTAKLVGRLGAQVYAPPPDGPDDPLEAQRFVAGDRLPIGFVAYPGLEPNDLVLWIESHRALTAGDTLIDRGNGLEFPADWANKGVPAEQILERMQPLLELPVDMVLPTHGPPAERDALERALG